MIYDFDKYIYRTINRLNNKTKKHMLCDLLPRLVTARGLLSISL